MVMQTSTSKRYTWFLHDPTIVLFDMCQLDEIEQFCCSQGKTSVLGVDVTFNLGAFYVTMHVHLPESQGY